MGVTGVVMSGVAPRTCSWVGVWVGVTGVVISWVGRGVLGVPDDLSHEKSLTWLTSYERSSAAHLLMKTRATRLLK